MNQRKRGRKEGSKTVQGSKKTMEEGTKLNPKLKEERKNTRRRKEDQRK